MLTKFIDNGNEISLESLSSMAIMLGEDPIIACENDTSAQGLTVRFKERVKGIIKMIKDFIQKIAMWVKGKLLNLLKRDSIVIDEELWLNANNTIKELDGIKVSIAHSFNLHMFAAKHENITFSDETEKTVRKIEAANEDYREKLDRVINGEYYKNTITRKTNGKIVTISTSSLAKTKQSIGEDLEILNDACKAMNNISYNTSPSFTNYQKGLSLLVATMRLRIQALEKCISIINVIISSGDRKNPNDRNDQKL